MATAPSINMISWSYSSQQNITTLNEQAKMGLCCQFIWNSQYSPSNWIGFLVYEAVRTTLNKQVGWWRCDYFTLVNVCWGNGLWKVGGYKDTSGKRDCQWASRCALNDITVMRWLSQSSVGSKMGQPEWWRRIGRRRIMLHSQTHWNFFIFLKKKYIII